MKIIDNKQAQKESEMGSAIIIDVRERAEFKEKHHSAALNFPLSEFSSELYGNYPFQKICLICNTQNRARQIAFRLEEKGIENVYVMSHGYEQLENKNHISESSIKGWTIDRQFRMTLGVLMVVFLIGYKFVGNGFLIIPIILATGLVFTSIIDRCYMRMRIALLPWNRGKKN